MAHPAILVQGLSKQYRLGANQQAYGTLRDSIVSWAKSPLRAFQRDATGAETFWALRDVSFNVASGEVIGVIGRNGAGKSTLLKILSRITEPTQGNIRIRGRVASLLEVGTGFHAELTGRENVFLNGAILGMHRHEIHQKFDEIVAFAEVEKFIDTPVKRYSSGMYLRLAFAVAAHLDPEILIVDEVLAVGDQSFQNKCLGKMREVANQGRTVLFVSHNMAAVQSLCSRVVMLKQGCLACEGLPDVVLADYLQTTTQRASRVALSDHPNRLSGSRRILHELEFQTLRPNSPAAVFMGETFTIRLRLATPDPLTTPFVNIGIDTVSGQRVCIVGTRFSEARLPSIQGEVWVECQVCEPNLMPGSYALKVSVGSGIADLDSIEAAALFEVLPTDYFGSGNLPNATQGSIAQRSVWALTDTQGAQPQ